MNWTEFLLLKFHAILQTILSVNEGQTCVYGLSR